MDRRDTRGLLYIADIWKPHQAVVFLGIPLLDHPELRKLPLCPVVETAMVVVPCGKAESTDGIEHLFLV